MSEPTLYEAMYILDPSLPDDEAAELIDTFEEIVREAGGEVVGTRDFRTRRLAYVIDRHTHGAYKLLYFHAEGDVVEMLRSEMAIRQAVIRSRVFVANPLAIVGGGEEAPLEVAEAEEAIAAEAAEGAPVEAEAAVEADAAEEAVEAESAEEAVEADAAEEAVEADAAEESAEPDVQQTPDEGE